MLTTVLHREYYDGVELKSTNRKEGVAKDMTDTKKFKAAMVEKGMTLAKLSEATGISTASLSYKINNHRQFSAREISTIQIILGLTATERDAIFFANCVDGSGC